MTKKQVIGSLIVFLGCLAMGAPILAGHRADVLAHGKLTLLCFPTTRGTHAFVKLDRLQEAGKPLGEIRDPDFFAGYEVDLVKRFAQELGVPLEVKAITTTYKDLIQALIGGEGDLIASSLTLTEKREQWIDFTIPFTFGRVSVIVPRESTVARPEDLSGLKGAVMQGSSQHEYLMDLGVEEIEIVLTDFSMENLAELEEGRVDFTLIDTTSEGGEAPAPDSPTMKVAFHLHEFSNGIALPEGSDLRPLLNEFLQCMIDTGEVARLVTLYQARVATEP